MSCVNRSLSCSAILQTTQAALDASSQAAIRLVAAPRRFKAEEIHQFYFGLKRRNTIVLIEPRDEKVDLRRNADLLKYAKNWLAADYLARIPGDAAKSSEFSRIGSEDKRNAVDYLKKTNFQHVQVVKFGASASDCEFQRENLPPAATREQIAQHLLRTLYPASLLQEHLGGRVTDLVGKKVSQVETDYLSTLGFPMLITHSVFHEAIHDLVAQGTVIGLRHPADNACGRRPRLTGDQLGDAVISEPFDVSAAPTTIQPQTAATSARLSTAPRTDSTGTTSESESTGQPATETVATSFLPSRQQIRQDVARLLEEQEGRRVVSVRIALTFDERTLETGSLPSFLRGSLSGPAKFSGESALEFSGVFTKPQVEEMVERLPDFTPGSCRVTLGVQTTERMN